MAEESGKAKDSKLKKGLQSAGKEMRDQGQAQIAAAESEAASRSDEKSPNSSPRFVDSYKRGGKIRKTGEARLHKGETVRKKRRGGRKMGRL